MAIASAIVSEIKLFLGCAAKGKIVALVQDLEKLISGLVIVLIPMIVYGEVYLISFDQSLAISTMGGTALAELIFAVHLLKSS